MATKFRDLRIGEWFRTGSGYAYKKLDKDHYYNAESYPLFGKGYKISVNAKVEPMKPVSAGERYPIKKVGGRWAVIDMMKGSVVAYAEDKAGAQRVSDSMGGGSQLSFEGSAGSASLFPELEKKSAGGLFDNPGGYVTKTYLHLAPGFYRSPLGLFAEGEMKVIPSGTAAEVIEQTRGGFFIKARYVGRDFFGWVQKDQLRMIGKAQGSLFEENPPFKVGDIIDVPIGETLYRVRIVRFLPEGIKRPAFGDMGPDIPPGSAIVKEVKKSGFEREFALSPARLAKAMKMNLEGYKDGSGVFHPIRGSKGYDDGYEQAKKVPYHEYAAKHGERPVRYSQHKPLAKRAKKHSGGGLLESQRSWDRARQQHEARSSRGFGRGGYHTNPYRPGRDTAYVDYAGGRYEVRWSNSDGDKLRWSFPFFEEVQRLAQKHNFNLILTAEAQNARSGWRYPAQNPAGPEYGAEWGKEEDSRDTPFDIATKFAERKGGVLKNLKEIAPNNYTRWSFTVKGIKYRLEYWKVDYAADRPAMYLVYRFDKSNPSRRRLLAAGHSATRKMRDALSPGEYLKRSGQRAKFMRAYRSKLDSDLERMEQGVKKLRENPETEVHELVLYITNDSGLYHQQTLPIIKNLARKLKKGVYNHQLAIKLWGYLATNGAKKYAREFSTGSDWSVMFSPQDRRDAAKELADEYMEAIQDTAEGMGWKRNPDLDIANPEYTDHVYVQDAFDAGKRAYIYDRDASGVANARVANYLFRKWYNNLNRRTDMGLREMAREAKQLQKAFMEGWKAGKRIEKGYKKNPGYKFSANFHRYSDFSDPPQKGLVTIHHAANEEEALERLYQMRSEQMESHNNVFNRKTNRFIGLIKPEPVGYTKNPGRKSGMSAAAKAFLSKKVKALLKRKNSLGQAMKKARAAAVRKGLLRNPGGRKWIQKAHLRRGALHRALHVRAGKRIPLGKLQGAARKPGRIGKEARFALTARGFRHNPKKTSYAKIYSRVLEIFTTKGTLHPGRGERIAAWGNKQRRNVIYLSGTKFVSAMEGARVTEIRAKGNQTPGAKAGQKWRHPFTSHPRLVNKNGKVFIVGSKPLWTPKPKSL